MCSFILQLSAAVQCCSKPYVVRRFREAVVLLVDEISMLSPVLLEVLNGIAQKARADSRPMGGMQVVFSGDFFQLPPVSKSPAESASGSSGYISAATSKGDSAGVRFCFQSPLWDALIQDSFDLQQVYRQSGDNDFIEVLNSVRCGQYTAQCSAVLGACVGRRLDCTDGILPTQIFTHKRDVDKLNSIRIAELPGTVTPLSYLVPVLTIKTCNQHVFSAYHSRCCSVWLLQARLWCTRRATRAMMRTCA